MSQPETPETLRLRVLDGDRRTVDRGERLRAPWCAPLRQMDAYWHGLRRGRVVPSRSDIDPRGIDGILEYAFVAERIATGHARIRIAGSHLCDVMGMEVRGMPLSAMLSPVSRNLTAELIAQVFDAPAQVDLSLTAEKRIGKPALNGRMMLLPMTDDFGDISRVLGCLVTDGKIGRAPRRFDIMQHDVLTLTPGFETRPVPSQSRAAAFAEPRTRFKPGPVPYLSVVRSED
ncbi:PAS domain-containing protein [Primorskyibacter aestuariivivens]|uniref:PAS domain-containing protein n=1 Tax=Primorskyibacter aestuariivivens TaxID=1888912 RepID=UPI002300B66E|nr:PAS domain-containing protein [Primorskyibacter aestuariivivens]MDA7428955.1 PAS domain-containing protein [Primorskyibacter aestuariivivens]